MKIRLKLTLLFTALLAALLLAFALVIYFSFAENRENEYFKRLKQQAITKANLLLNIKVTPAVLQLIYKNSPNTLYQEEVAIYDTAFHLLYHDAVEIDKVKETHQMIERIVRLKEIRFYVNKMQAVGFLYNYQGRNYVITSAALDNYGFNKLKNLKYTLIICSIVVILLTLIAGNFFSRKALQPVSRMVKKVEDITVKNLDLRVDEGNRKDEIAELAVTFNQMLDRLEKSFDAQKQFVSHISHELRTPLSMIITELDLSLNKPRTNEEYRDTIKRSLIDSNRLVKLSNDLLDLAKASYDQSEIVMKELRLDELLVDARQTVLKSNLAYKVNIAFEQEIEDDDFISVVGNVYLLKVAFINIIENGCKFSQNHQSTVSISFQAQNTILRFSDSGIGISDEDLPNIFTPFYRGENEIQAEGHGIGLALTNKIIQLHKGTITVVSKLAEGTIFTIELPHV